MRISATLLESFRRLQAEPDPELADKMEYELIASIRRETVETPAMRIGTAYHAILEKPQKQLSGFYEHQGIRFEYSAIETLLGRLDPNGIFEVPQARTLLIPGTGLVTLSTRCDHIAGSRISEFKATLSTFDSEKYMASVQWKVMAMLFEASAVTYHVACLKEEDSWYSLKSLETMNVFPYAGMEQGVRSLLREFCDYVHAVRLTNFLLPREPEVRPQEKTVLFYGAQPS